MSQFDFCRASRVSAVVVIAMTLAGCGIFGSDKKKPLTLPALSGNVASTAWQVAGTRNVARSTWNFFAGQPTEYVFSPAVSDGKVHVATSDGVVQIYDETSGRPVGSIATGAKLTAGVGAAQGLVAVANDKGEVMAFLDGKLAWRASVSGEVLASPEVGPNVVVARTSDGRVMAFNSADGKRRWVFTRATPSLTLRSSAGVVITRTEVVMGFAGGRVLALDMDTGKLLAEFSVATPRGASDLERVVDVAGTPHLEERRVCAVAFQGRVACFDPRNGATLWAKDASSSAGLAGDSKNLYIAQDDGSVQAVSKEVGASVWKNDQLMHRSLTQPLVVGNYVVVGDNLGFVHVLSPETGALVGRVTTDGSAVHSITPMGSQAVAQTAAGGVFALKI